VLVLVAVVVIAVIALAAGRQLTSGPTTTAAPRHHEPLRVKEAQLLAKQAAMRELHLLLHKYHLKAAHCPPAKTSGDITGPKTSGDITGLSCVAVWQVSGFAAHS
jgi:hypothetical protein